MKQPRCVPAPALGTLVLCCAAQGPSLGLPHLPLVPGKSPLAPHCCGGESIRVRASKEPNPEPSFEKGPGIKYSLIQGVEVLPAVRSEGFLWGLCQGQQCLGVTQGWLSGHRVGTGKEQGLSQP